MALASCADLPDWEVDDRPLVSALEAEGLDVVVAPWDQLAPWDADAVWIRTTWDYTERLDAFLAWADAIGPRLLVPPAVVRWNADKRYLRALEQAGVPLAPTRWLDAGQDPGPALAEARWRTAFIKPVVGASSSGTLRFHADADGLARARDHLAALGQPAMLQPYLRNVEEEGEVSVIVVDGRVAHAVRKIPPAGDYRVQDDHGAVDQPLGLFQGEDAFALRVVDALIGLHGAVLRGRAPLVARVDTLRDDRGRLVLNELELIEPSLFFRHGPDTATALARAVAARLRPAR